VFPYLDTVFNTYIALFSLYFVHLNEDMPVLLHVTLHLQLIVQKCPVFKMFFFFFNVNVKDKLLLNVS